MCLAATGSIALAVASFVHLSWTLRFIATASLRFQQPAGWTLPDSEKMSNMLAGHAQESP